MGALMDNSSYRLSRLSNFLSIGILSAVFFVKCGTEEQTSKTAGDSNAAEYQSYTATNNYVAVVDYAELKARKTVTVKDIETAIDIDLASLSSQERRFTRYFTLVNLYNGGVSSKELAAFRNGLSKMLNSLSYNRDIIPPKPVDLEKLIFRVNLRDYGWSRFSWDEISRRDPYAFFTNSSTERNIRRNTGVRFQSYARADWFAVNGLQAPLYHLLLDIPQNIRNLEFQIGVNADNNIRRREVVRGGFNGSGVSQQNRIVEWHDSKFGGYWKSYDFEPSNGRRRRNIFEFPLENRNFGGEGFDFAGGEMIFQLPNGLSGYILTDANGRRIDKAPTQIVADPTRPDVAVANGLSCFRCHHSGMIPFRDMIRDHVQKNSFAFSRRDSEIVENIYAPQSIQLGKLREYDLRFSSAIKQLGFPYAPAGGINESNEPVYLLARQFEAEIPITLVAGEFGLTPSEFLTSLAKSRFLSRRIGNLTLDATIKREILEDNFGFIVKEFRLGEPLFRNSNFSLTGGGAEVEERKDSESDESLTNRWEEDEVRTHTRN
jgi:hypothetical protein